MMQRVLPSSHLQYQLLMEKYQMEDKVDLLKQENKKLLEYWVLAEAPGGCALGISAPRGREQRPADPGASSRDKHLGPGLGPASFPHATLACLPISPLALQLITSFIHTFTLHHFHDACLFISVSMHQCFWE